MCRMQRPSFLWAGSSERIQGRKGKQETGGEKRKTERRKEEEREKIVQKNGIVDDSTYSNESSESFHLIKYRREGKRGAKR